MAQGAAQFCRRSAFDLLTGYDESYFMGEDVDFYWRLQKLSATWIMHTAVLPNAWPLPAHALRLARHPEGSVPCHSPNRRGLLCRDIGGACRLSSVQTPITRGP
jgi:hypothetical protein